MTSDWIAVAETAGRLEAEILKGMLEFIGLHVRLSQESAGATYGLSVGPLGRVELMVLAGEETTARSALDDYYSGTRAEADAPKP